MSNEIDKNWIDIDTEIPNGVIRTLHTDGKEDVCRVINGKIFSHDAATDAPITHYKMITPLPSELPSPPTRLREVIEWCEEQLQEAKTSKEKDNFYLGVRETIEEILPKLKSLTDEPDAGYRERELSYWHDCQKEWMANNSYWKKRCELLTETLKGYWLEAHPLTPAAYNTDGERIKEQDRLWQKYLSNSFQPTDEPDAGYSGWISVEDRLPDDGRDVLVTDGDACMVASWEHIWNFFKNDFWESIHVKYWRELPNPPTQTNPCKRR